MKREVVMRERRLTIPEIILLGGTRVALGAGIGLLLAGKLNNDQRKGAGAALTVIGALTTIPIAINIIKKPEVAERTAA
jgi:hypothetical protein